MGKKRVVLNCDSKEQDDCSSQYKYDPGEQTVCLLNLTASVTSLYKYSQDSIV